MERSPFISFRRACNSPSACTLSGRSSPGRDVKVPAALSSPHRYRPIRPQITYRGYILSVQPRGDRHGACDACGLAPPSNSIDLQGRIGCGEEPISGNEPCMGWGIEAACVCALRGFPFPYTVGMQRYLPYHRSRWMKGGELKIGSISLREINA